MGLTKMADTLVVKDKDTPENNIFEFLDLLGNMSEMSPESFYTSLRGKLLQTNTVQSHRNVIKLIYRLI